MGKRSRKRVGGAEVTASPTSRAERDAARHRRAAAQAREAQRGSSARRRPGRTSYEDRPPAPWGNFPLVELCVLAGIVLAVVGFVIQGERGGTMFLCGLALAALGGLELSIREHFTGFRSHTSLLAGALAALALALTYFVTKDRVLMLPVAAIVFLGAFLLFRRVFQHRSGGVSFRR
jgi:hypothetical protein